MGIWTTKNGQRYNINIDQDFINKMQSYGARFCWMRENYQIDNENSDYYKDCEVDGNKKRKLKEGITVICEDRERITGYITHWVKGDGDGTNQTDWFIIQPGTYPTYCN